MAQEIAFAAPRAEEMTKVVTTGAGAGITGMVVGVVIKMAPQLGALEPLAKWGTLLGTPLMGIGGALFTRGMLSDLFMGVACGGLAVTGYVLPELIAPITGRRGQGGGLPAGAGIKQLGAGQTLNAPDRAQQAARVGLEF